MKGIERHIDSLGRLVIPKEFRDAIGLDFGDAYEALLQDDHIIIRKPILTDKCIICGSSDVWRRKNDKYVCDSCVADLAGGA